MWNDSQMYELNMFVSANRICILRGLCVPVYYGFRMSGWQLLLVLRCFPILSCPFWTLLSSCRSCFSPADHKDVSVMMSEMDVNAIAGTLKLYFRELPEPLFTDDLYPNFAGGISKSQGYRHSQIYLITGDCSLIGRMWNSLMMFSLCRPVW